MTPTPSVGYDTRACPITVNRWVNAAKTYAAQYLAAHGYAIRARNWHCPLGELDLVTERDDQVIFVEVRTRQTDRLGTPEESITPAKRAKLIAAAQTYLDEHDQTRSGLAHRRRRH